MKTTATDFLGEYGALERGHSKRVRERGSNQQRKHGVDVVRQLQSENDGGERGTHGPAQNRSHRNEGRESSAFGRKEHGEHSSQGATHHEKRRQNTSRRS